jgi:hypothetical protein
MIRGHDNHRRHSCPGTLRQAIQPLLPTPPCRYGGRPRINDRAALVGIVYQLRTAASGGCSPLVSSAAAAPSPAGGGCATGSAPGPGSVCTRCCSTSSAATASLPGPARAWTRSACPPDGGALTGPNPTDRGKPGSKYHLLVDRSGLPMAAGCLLPIPMTRCCWSLWWTRCRRSRARVAGPGGHAGGLPSCTVTTVTTTRAADIRCADAGSRPGSPDVGSSPVTSWAGTARWWSGRWPG